MHAYRPYQILRKFDNAPTLPFDYLYSMLLALVPTLWYRTIDPLLERVQENKPPLKNFKIDPMVKLFFVGFNAFLTAMVV